MTWLEKNRQFILKRDKEKRSNYSCSKLFLANIPFMLYYFEQFTDNEFLDWYFERLCFTLSFPQCSHFIPTEIIEVTFGFLMFSGIIKPKLWEETGQVFKLISAQCSSFIPLKTSENLRSSFVSSGYKIGTLGRNW